MSEYDAEIIDDEELDLEEEHREDDEPEGDPDEDTDDLEESAAAETLKPHGAPGETKAQMLSTFTQLMSQIGKEDLSNLFNQVQAQFGPNKAPGAVDNSGKNKASISGKPSAAKGTGAIAPQPMQHLGIKEDLDELFTEEELNEEFRDKASTIFEAAINTRLNIELVRLEEENEDLRNKLHEEYEAKLEESTSQILEDLETKLDKYLDNCVTEWMEENKLAVETSLRADIAEGFITSLRNVFAEHYIEVPEDRFDIVTEMKTELDELKSKLTETLDENLDLKAKLTTIEVEDIVETVIEGLPTTQAEKLKQLSEGIEFGDTETFTKKLTLIKEQFLTKKPSNTGLITETIDGDADTVDPTSRLDDKMKSYVNAIKR